MYLSHICLITFFDTDVYARRLYKINNWKSRMCMRNAFQSRHEQIEKHRDTDTLNFTRRTRSEQIWERSPKRQGHTIVSRWCKLDLRTWHVAERLARRCTSCATTFIRTDVQVIAPNTFRKRIFESTSNMFFLPKARITLHIEDW